MQLGLAARLALLFACLVAATTLITTMAGVFSTRGQVMDDIDRFLRDRADEIVTGERQNPRDRDQRRRRNDDDQNTQAEIDEIAVQAAVDADAEVQSLAADGAIESTVGVALPVERVDLELAAQSGRSVLRTVSIDGVEYRMLTGHVEGGGAIQVARDLDGTNELLRGIQSRMFLIGLVLSALAAAAGWLVARGTTRPLRRLTDSIETVAETQDLSITVGLDRSDEIGRLATEFDRMLETLTRSREQQHRLVHDAAHELRTPLTSIHANIEFLSRARDLDEEVRGETLAAVRSELSELSALFNEIIELATDVRDAPDHRELNLAEAVEAAVRSFEARSSSPIELTKTDSPVVGDAEALIRAVTNLLGNAEKYGPAGAPISVEVGGGRVAITDRGPGIPAAERELVFERFYRGEEARSRPGSGLGLAIVQKIVDDHGGKTWITEASEGGTTAGFDIPARH